MTAVAQALRRHRRGAPLQPLLHAADRRAAPELSRQPLFARRDARALRARPIGEWQRRTASDIARALDLDAGYLSRVLRNFEKRGLITRKTSREDARQSHLALTARGAKLFAPFEKRSQDQVGDMLGKLDAERTGAAGRRPCRPSSAARRQLAARRQAALPSARAQARRFRLDRHPPRPSSTPRNTAGPSRSRACARRSSPTSSTISTPSWSAAGSPR